MGDKGGKKEKIVLVKGDRIIQEDAEVAKAFNDFFDNAVKSLGIMGNKMLLTDVINSQGKVLVVCNCHFYRVFESKKWVRLSLPSQNINYTQ